ncbi:MAG: cytochrome c [Nitrospirota bacterium]|nr:cytochrome c [Nitrospirota bacterium]
MSTRAGQGRFAIAVLLLSLLWAPLAAPVHADDAVSPRAAELLYRTYCIQCHGLHGTGSGINVRDMAVQPRDHTDSEAMSGLNDERLFKAIREGGPAVTKSVLMPPWGGVLSDPEIHALVKYLRKLCACEEKRGPG